MVRKIQMKRGTTANTPRLADGELGLQTDAGKLVIGNGGDNISVLMDAELNAVTAELRGAIADSSPADHTHTAAQVGARPNNWAPSKADIGLSNVDNTADSQKSVNYANAAGNTNAVGGRAASTVLNEIDGAKASEANGRAQIANAITEKGIGTSAGVDFGTLASNIRSIKTWVKWSNTDSFEVAGYETVDISKYLFVFGYTDRIVMIDVQNRRAFAWDGHYDSIITNPIQVDTLDIGYSFTYHANAKTIVSNDRYDSDFIGVY